MMIFKKYFSNTHVRSARAIKNIISTFFIKGISIVINLALVPLTINYLSPTKYGVWLTISAVLGWVNFFDIGLGHGLRNKLAESIAHNEMKKAKSYVSTAYISISVLCVALFGVFVIINHYLNWNVLLNIPIEIDEDIKSVALIVFSMFSIQFTLQLINSILLSNQLSARVSFNNMLSNLLVLIGIALLIKFTDESLFHIAFLFSIIPVFVLIGVNIYYFNNNFKSFAPSLRDFDFSALRDVLHLGIKFFVIQITVLIFFETSNLLICRYFSPELVTPYNIAFRYFGMITMVFSIIMSPYWSAYTEAYAKQDFLWIRRSLRQLFRIWILLVIVSIFMLLFSNYAYHLWVGDQVKVDFSISVCMMIYVLVTAFGNIYIMMLNGIGDVKLQMIVNIIGMLVFIPLSYVLAVALHLGVIGIIISTIICSLYGPIIAPLQEKRNLNKYKASEVKI